jgi:hypothetical protein
MKMRNLLMGLLVAASTQGAATAARADTVMLVDIVLPTKAGVAPPNAVAEIKVDGPQKGPYDSVQSKSLEYIIGARGERHKRFVGDPFFWLTIDGGGSSGNSKISEDWKYFAVKRDYVDPHATGIENRRVSPIELCNAKLNAADESARAAFLKKGVTFLHKDAYNVRGTVSAEFATGKDFETVEESETIHVPVKITCMPLDRPRPRRDGSTKGPPPREGKQMQPTIKEMTLRIEPAKVVQDGKFLCPSQLTLHGFVETRREFYGKALFVGPHYLSSITTLNLQSAGTRNVSGTYEMDWHKMGGLTTAPNTEPKKQKLTFHFNVADKDGKLLKSVEETVEVSCKKIKVNAPTAGNGVMVAPAN